MAQQIQSEHNKKQQDMMKLMANIASKPKTVVTPDYASGFQQILGLGMTVAKFAMLF